MTIHAVHGAGEAKKKKKKEVRTAYSASRLHNRAGIWTSVLRNWAASAEQERSQSWWISGPDEKEEEEEEEEEDGS